MKSFAFEWLFTLSAMATLGFIGWPLMLPFRNGRRFVVLLAPMFGLITLPLVVIAIYVFAKLSLSWSAMVAIGLMSLMSIAVICRWRPVRDDVLCSLMTAIVVSAIATALSNAATIQSGVPSITFIDGSDHAGYGHVADWLINHDIGQRPIVNPEIPYESWPQLILSLDPRAGSFVFLALVAMARSLSGLFAYDSACAVVSTIGSLAVAAAFARTRLMLLLLAVGLMGGSLIDLGRAGYLGKLTAYPAALFLLGLFITSTRRDLPWIGTMILLTVGIATLHSGSATAFLIVTIGATYLASKILLEARKIDNWSFLPRDAVLLVLLVFVAFAATGLFARPISSSPSGTLPVGWDWLLVRFFEIENPAVDHVRSIFARFAALQMAAIGLQVVAIVAAFLVGSTLAFALCFWPLAILASLYVADQKWIVLQLSGLLFWCTLVGIAVLYDELRMAARRAAFVAIAAIGLVFVAVRAPRLAVAIDRYVVRTDPQYRYQAATFDEIRRIVGSDILEVDTDEPLPLIAALNELGGRGTKLQWSPRAWTRAFGYRKWPPPQYSTRPDYRLIVRTDPAPAGSLVLETSQYRLWRLLPAR